MEVRSDVEMDGRWQRRFRREERGTCVESTRVAWKRVKWIEDDVNKESLKKEQLYWVREFMTIMDRAQGKDL